MANDTIDSNEVQTRFCREETPGVLVANADRVWWPLDLNSFSDFGADYTKQARTPLSSTRQRRKGVNVDLDVAGGFEHDYQPDLLNRLLQSFMFARFYEQTDSKQYYNTSALCTGVLASDDSYNFATAIIADSYCVGPNARRLIVADGFTNDANNGFKTLASTAQTGAKMVAADALVDETPPANARVRVVGRSFSAGDLSMVAIAGTGRFALRSAAANMNSMNVRAGQWIFIGGDADTSNFTNPVNRGFARVYRTTPTDWELDLTTFQPVADTSTGNFVHVYFAAFIKNETDVAKRFRTTFQFERELGSNDTDEPFREYVGGALGATFALKLTEASKVECSLALVGLSHELHDGTVARKTGRREALGDEPVFNTASDLLYAELYRFGADTTPPSIVGYLTESEISIDNGVEKRGALGVMGGIGHSSGDFVVDAKMTAYFTDTRVLENIAANTTCGAYYILGGSNTGVVVDIPALTLAGGKPTVEKDGAVMLEMTNPAHGSNGVYTDHTLSFSYFPYLPKIAAPATSESAAVADGGDFVDYGGADM